MEQVCNEQKQFHPVKNELLDSCVKVLASPTPLLNIVVCLNR